MESGKTTILKGIEQIGKHCSELEKSSNEPLLTNGERKAIIPKLKPGDYFDNKIIFSCEISSFNTNQEQEKYELSFSYEFKSDKFKEYSVVICHNGKNLEGEEFKKNANLISDKIPKVLFYGDFTFEVPEDITFNVGETEQKNEEWSLLLQDIMDSMSGEKVKRDFQKDIVNYLSGENAGDINGFDDKLTGISKHINKKITKKWLSALGKESNLKEIIFDCRNKDINNSERKFYFRVKSINDSRLDMNARSKGCQWFFAFMLLTEFRKFREKNTIFLLDEPASNLHASMQKKVMDVLNELNDKDNQASVIYSTHSSYLLNLEKNIESVFLVENFNSEKEDQEPDIKINSFLKVLEDTSEAQYEKAKPILDYIGLNILNIVKELKGEKFIKENKTKQFFLSFIQKGLPYIKDFVASLAEKNI